MCMTQNPVGNTITEGQYRFIILAIDYHTIYSFHPAYRIG